MKRILVTGGAGFLGLDDGLKEAMGYFRSIS